MKITAATMTCAIAALTVSSCSGPPATATGIEFGGCKTVLDGPVCVIDGIQPLTIWISGTATRVQFSADSAQLEPERAEPVHGGMRYFVQPAPAAQTLHLRIDDGDARTQWQLALSQETDPEWLEVVTALRQAGETQAAREALLAVLDDTTAPRRATAQGQLGRMELVQGNHAQARTYLRAAMLGNEHEGRPYDALRDGLALTFSLLHGDKQFTAARELLERFDGGTGQAEWPYLLAYHRGDAAAEAGDTRGALEQFARAVTIAERFDWQPRRLHSSQLLAVQLQQLGRRDDARAIFDTWSALPTGIGECTRALYLTNVGWSELLALEAGEPADDTLTPLLAAQALASEHCPAGDIANAHINLALAYVHAGNAVAATAQLEQARAAVAEPPLRLQLWALDIDARIASLQGDRERAATLYTQLERLAGATLSPAARWRAAVGKATLARNDGRLNEAIAAFERADRLLAADLARIPLTAGRESFLATRQWATRQYLAALLDSGNTEQAYTLARRARQLVLYSLSPKEHLAMRWPGQLARWEQALAQYETLRAELTEQARSRWSVPEDDLAQIESLASQRRHELDSILDVSLTAIGLPEAAPSRAADGELFVVLHPLEEGWAVFADDGTTVNAVRRACDLTAADAGHCLLAPLAKQIARASLLVLMPAGAANKIDFHATPIDGMPLAQTTPVLYAADLPAFGMSIPSAGKILLVADPLGDLPGARAEATALQGALADDWNVNVLQGAAADATTVRQQLSQSELFHFAGHASFGGTRGWQSVLRLAEDTVLSINDILALPRPPAVVVLSGCETATTASAQLPDSMSIANAFIVSGTDVVLAATRPVPDRITSVLMTVFYNHWHEGATLPDALRVAQARIRESDPSADWAAFRLIARAPTAMAQATSVSH